MKKHILAALALVVFSALVAASSLSSVSAYTCGKTVDSTGAETAIPTSIDFTAGGAFSGLCNGDGASPINAMLLWAIGILGAGVGVAVVIGIVLGGITYAMSDGDEGKVKEGRGMVVNAVIGLFLFIFLWAAANFMIPGGVFK